MKGIPMLIKPSIIYLACPYSHKDESIKLERFHRANVAAAFLIKLGHVVYSPISMTHPIDQILIEDGCFFDSSYWVNFDETFMNICEAIVILKIDGWNLSSGVKREIEYFKNKGIDPLFLDENNNFIRI